MLDQLQEQIRLVAQAREHMVFLADIKKKRMAEWEAEHAGLLKDIEDNRQILAEAEALLREKTITAYKETGNKSPCPGVAIRIVTKLDYDATLALNYAKEHGVALKLDTSAFEKMAKISELRPGFVTVTEEPQATIATDLSKIIEPVK